MSEIERCPTCGSSVRLEGTITRYFMPVENERIADLERQLAVRIQESNEWEALARDRQEEIEAMRPMIEACEYRYKTHKYYSPPEDVTCTCLTCQWYRDYEARKPK